MILKLIQENFGPFAEEHDDLVDMPDSLVTEVPSIMANCNIVLDEFGGGSCEI